MLDRKCRGGEEKASWGQRASSPMDGRPGDGQGLSGEVGFTEQKSSMLYPRTQRSEIATVELRQDGGNAAQATGQSKGRWEDCLLAPRGHRKRRPGPLPPEESKASSGVVFTRPVTCVDIRGADGC